MAYYYGATPTPHGVVLFRENEPLVLPSMAMHENSVFLFHAQFFAIKLLRENEYNMGTNWRFETPVGILIRDNLFCTLRALFRFPLKIRR